MINRRRFLKSIVAAAAAPAITQSCVATRTLDRKLRPDANQIMDLPSDFSYTIISRVGEPMTDGLFVPGLHDGMAAFDGDNGRIILVRNHELNPKDSAAGPYGDAVTAAYKTSGELFYDRGEGVTPGLGGTTTTIYNRRSQQVERQFLSLAGTEINCSGGKTPWGSWLSCEESFGQPGDGTTGNGDRIVREQRHGYVFEVPASATTPVKPVPIRAMGRFEHEAVAVHESSGILYLTEDRWHSLFYRFIPDVPGQLHRGGQLQALAIAGQAAQRTHNWGSKDVELGNELSTYWVDLDNVDSAENDLRKRGAAAGAAMFARGEGVIATGDRIIFTCTIGGPARLGQVFAYEPSPDEGSDREQESPGKLSLIAESDENSLHRNCDNLTMAPWGDLIVCEDIIDGSGNCSLIGIRTDGHQYVLANNAYSSSELAGVCFSPDGQTMFVNIQKPGMTLAITGPWPTS